jgi:small GTP-binding protein
METGQPVAAIQKKICMIGAYAVGKTSLVRRFVESKFDERYKTTIGVKIDRKRVVVRDRDVNLVLWDLAGDDELAQLRVSHLRGASGYILVADGTRISTLDRAFLLQEWIAVKLGPAPFVLALNKVDLQEEWRIEEDRTERLAQQGWAVFSTSAKTGQGVEELFLSLAEKVLLSTAEPASYA